MTDFFFYLFRFLFGGAAYCTIELVYRGRTHYSMFFAGGIILAAFYCLERTQPDLRLALKCLMGAGIITGVELVFGLVFKPGAGYGRLGLQPGAAEFMGPNLPALYADLAGL